MSEMVLNRYRKRKKRLKSYTKLEDFSGVFSSEFCAEVVVSLA